MKIRIAGTVRKSVIDPGLRFIMFAQSCRHQCKDYHNLDTRAPLGGIPVKVEDLLEQIKNEKLIKGVTFSGGEPFLPAGPAGKSIGAGHNHVYGIFLGKAAGDPARDQDAKELLLVSDYVVDGLL